MAQRATDQAGNMTKFDAFCLGIFASVAALLLGVGIGYVSRLMADRKCAK